MRRAWMAGVVTLSLAGPAWATGSPQVGVAAEGLAQLSIEELANIDISSVSKADQPLSEAPAAIFVITHEDAVRSGATTLPELLRLAPNLQVAQVTASAYAITARGFNGTAASKLLVLIDGRSVYTPFYSGVFWDVQDIPLDQIERVEVISGPGATLWGANAVNGVINVVTRQTTEGRAVRAWAGLGDQERRAELEVAGPLADGLTGRVYLTGRERDASLTGAGLEGHDDWRKTQGGFRLDWRPEGSGDLITLQGDAYGGSEGTLRNRDTSLEGFNLLSRWSRQLKGGGQLQVQAYYDYLQRTAPGTAQNQLQVWDIEAQHSFTLGGAHQVVWGGGFRLMKDRFPISPDASSTTFQVFTPEKRNFSLGNIFAQDTFTLSPNLKLTVGLKLEDDAYVGLEVLPSVRASWTPTETSLVWAAVSRAVRAPSRIDRDFTQAISGTTILVGGVFHSEELIAYEAGLRVQPSQRSSLSVSAFYNVYEELRSFEPMPGPALPLVIRNELEGETWGLEAWGAYQVTDWWRLSAGGNWLKKDLDFKPGSFQFGGVHIAANDPDYQLQLRSRMDLPGGVGLDLGLRRVGALPAPVSPAYFELDGRVAWAVTDNIELSLRGQNLLHKRHLEYGSQPAALQLGEVGVQHDRSVFLDARLRF